MASLPFERPDEPISFHVPGIPVAKGRARVSTRGGVVRSFTPQKTVAFESRVALAAEQAMAGMDPLEGPVALRLTIELPIAQSWSLKKKNGAINGSVKPTSRPDIDNYIKAIADGGNGIVWKDDSQITDLSAVKRYGMQPGVTAEVTSL